MIKIAALFTASLVAIASAAHAEPAAQSYMSADGEYLLVETRELGHVPKAFPAVADIVQNAGYLRRESTDIPPQMKTDTWCKVIVHHEREILGECYTPRQGHGVAVSDHVTTFAADYSRVPAMVARLRDEHRRASALLAIR